MLTLASTDLGDQSSQCMGGKNAGLQHLIFLRIKWTLSCIDFTAALVEARVHGVAAHQRILSARRTHVNAAAGGFADTDVKCKPHSPTLVGLHIRA